MITLLHPPADEFGIEVEWLQPNYKLRIIIMLSLGGIALAVAKLSLLLGASVTPMQGTAIFVFILVAPISFVQPLLSLQYQSFLRKGRYKEALPWLKAHLAWLTAVDGPRPRQADLLVLIGGVYKGQNEIDSAGEAFRTVVDAQHKYISACDPSRPHDLDDVVCLFDGSLERAAGLSYLELAELNWRAGRKLDAKNQCLEAINYLQNYRSNLGKKLSPEQYRKRTLEWEHEHGWLLCMLSPAQHFAGLESAIGEAYQLRDLIEED